MNGSSIAGRRPPGAPCGERFLHVLAGAKAAAGPGKDRDFELAVAAELGPGFGEPRAHFMAERIEPLGPVHPHDQDLPLALGLDNGHDLFLSDDWPPRGGRG